MKKERKENVWRTSGIKEQDIDNIFLEWEDNLQTHACRMNFVTGSVVEHLSAESEGMRFGSSWELKIFFFVPRS